MRSVRVCMLVVGCLVSSCSMSANHATGVYVLVAVQKSDSRTLQKAQAIVDYLLATLQPNDILAVAGIDSRSFSEKDIVAEVRFDQRPSVTIKQKRAFKQALDAFMARASGSADADFSGGILQAVEYLNAAGCANKYIMLLADLEQETGEGVARETPFQLSGFTVIALDPNRTGGGAPKAAMYKTRTEKWRATVENSNGKWLSAGDVAALRDVFEE